ncbi:hypothetical protein Tco_0265388 [Tanacetum coccineum]
MDTSKRGYIPMQEKLDLNKTQGASTPEEVKRMQNVPYASAVGSIMYEVRFTRPEVAFTNTKDMNLVYGGNPEAKLRVDCYCDAAFETDRDDTKSQTGYFFVLNRGAVDWKSSKQSTTAMSATEAEYIAASEAAMESVWIRKFISGLDIDLTKDPYDDLFDRLQQYEKIVIASRAKKLAKTHDPLALIAHTSSSSSRPPPAYYVTHPSSVVDYDDDYQGDTLQDDPEDPLTSAMMLLARAITQSEMLEMMVELQGDCTTFKKNLLRIAIKKGHYACNCPNPRVRDSKYLMEQMLLAKKDEVGVSLSNEHNDFLIADAAQMEENKELSSNICMMFKIQLTNIDSDDGPSYDSTFIKVNIGSIAHDKNDHDSHDNELEQLARNAYKKAEKQQILAQKVKQQNVELTKQLE